MVSARSNNLYQSQKHEFDFQLANCSKRDCCELHNCPMIGELSHNRRVRSLGGQLTNDYNF